jgi:serine/threonine protein kinase
MTPSVTIQPRDALAVGTVLNGYRILGALGRGGFGITYRATDLLDQFFAIKEFFPRQFAMRSGQDVVVSSDADQPIFEDCRKRFLTEARLLAAFGRNGGTQGIVRVQTFFEANNTAYSVMELLHGDTLADVLETSGSVLAADVLDPLLRGILAPLAKVHAAGFLHRDIKPANILISPDGRPVLIDFGSARDIGPNANTAWTQVYSGHYAPIEQVHGGPQGPFSDLYSVGGVAYRAIGGKLIDARQRQQAALSRLSDPLIPAVEVGRTRYPIPILRAIDRALALAAEDRPQRAEDMLTLLDKPAEGELTIRLGEPAPSSSTSARPTFSHARTSRPGVSLLHRLRSAVMRAIPRTGWLVEMWRRLVPAKPEDPWTSHVRHLGSARRTVPIVTVGAGVAVAVAGYYAASWHDAPLSPGQRANPAAILQPPANHPQPPLRLEPPDSLASPKSSSPSGTDTATLTTTNPALPLPSGAAPPPAVASQPETPGASPQPAPTSVAAPPVVALALPPPSVAVPPSPPPADESWSSFDRQNLRVALRLLRLSDVPATGEPFAEKERAALARLQEMVDSRPLGGAAGDDLRNPRAFASRLTALLVREPTSPRGVRGVALPIADQVQRGWQAEKRGDWPEAIYWYRLAANAGDPWACAHLGYALAQGNRQGGVLQDAALLWWIASQRGEGEASYNLGALYDYEAPRNANLARQWYSLALSQGYQKAADDLRKLRP